MARPKKDRSYCGENVPVDEDGMVYMLSSRPGDIRLQNGQTIIAGKAFKVDEPTAQWLETSFKEFVQRID